MVLLESIVKTYKTGAGEFAALKGVSLSIESGDFVALWALRVPENQR